MSIVSSLDGLSGMTTTLSTSGHSVNCSATCFVFSVGGAESENDLNSHGPCTFGTTAIDVAAHLRPMWSLGDARKDDVKFTLARSDSGDLNSDGPSIFGTTAIDVAAHLCPVWSLGDARKDDVKFYVGQKRLADLNSDVPCSFGTTAIVKALVSIEPLAWGCLNGVTNSANKHGQFCFSWSSIHLFGTLGKNMHFGFPLGGHTTVLRTPQLHGRVTQQQV